MKTYIKRNWSALITGFAIAMIYNSLIEIAESIIIKLALI